MALDDLPETSPTKFDLKQVLTAANRAKELVQQILSFSRLGEQQLLRPVDASLIVKEALKLLRASLPSSIDIQPNIDRVMILADATQIHQVVVNLCTNAAHAMEDRGTLGVSLREVSLNAQDIRSFCAGDVKPGRYLQLNISDTGEGMSDETMSRIFEPYFTTKELNKGTGLGLAVVHGIVKRHGGEIRVRSEVGKGSVFDVYIPVAEDEANLEVDPSEALPLGTEHILLVDDELAIADYCVRMLRQLGYTVTAKTRPREALELFQSDPDAFDLIITDYTMPDMVGTDLALAIMSIRPEIPVILCTGFSQRVSEGALRDMGIKGFAMKPFNRSELAGLIRSVLDRVCSNG
jgi:two-component system, cell cycle sensor histidine kinase and response regulator CckA